MLNYKIIILLFTLTLVTNYLDAQGVLNSKFDQRIKNLINFDIPVIGVDSVYSNIEKFVFVDTRERDEYEVSHIPNAHYSGYDDFDLSNLMHIDKDSEIVVYCSIGYRSEKIGKKLKKAGYKNVYNLYGSIFEWVNRGYPIVDTSNQRTRRLHTYNKIWSKWVDNPDILKIW